MRPLPDGERPRGIRFARVVHAVAVLLLFSTPALAAPARHHKRGHRPPTPQAEPDSGSQPATDTLPPDSTDAPPDAAPAPPEPAAPVPAEEPAAAVELPVAAATRPAPARAPDVSGPRDAELALGRLEAARISAGRIEVAVMTSLDVGRRDFTYSDPVGAAPQSYRLAAAPLATVGMDVYPFASTGVPVLQDLGVRGRFSRAFAIGSSTTLGAHLDTTWMRFGGELRERFLSPVPRVKELGVAVGVDGDDFAMHTEGDVGALVPSARTVALRFGPDATLFVSGRVSLLLGAAYLATLSRGEIYDRFRRPRVKGVDGDVAVALRLTAGLELRLAGRYTRYFAAFDPQVGDALVAGGALDQQFQVGLGVRYAH